MGAGKGTDNRLDLTTIFNNDRSVEVDLGCGKGLFLVQEASARPSINFIGVDRMERKTERAHRRMQQRGLENVRLFKSDVFHFVHRLLPKESISAFHVYFPDPWPKRRHYRRRFVGRLFVKALACALISRGKVWIATDDLPYYEEILSRFDESLLFSRMKIDKPAVHGTTDFEEHFLENDTPIYRVGFVKVE